MAGTRYQYTTSPRKLEPDIQRKRNKKRLKKQKRIPRKRKKMNPKRKNKKILPKVYLAN